MEFAETFFNFTCHLKSRPSRDYHSHVIETQARRKQEAVQSLAKQRHSVFGVQKDMDLLTKFTFVVSCLFSGWVITLINIANCSVYPSEMSVDVALKLPSAVMPVSQASGLGLFYSLSLSSTFPDDLEVNEYCIKLLHIYGERYVTYANCLVSYARPVKVCQNCYTYFNSLEEIYSNISSDQVSAHCKFNLL